MHQSTTQAGFDAVIAIICLKAECGHCVSNKPILGGIVITKSPIIFCLLTFLVSILKAIVCIWTL
jgi:hypothetical protein